MPDNTLELTDLKPHYITIDGWGNLDNVNDAEDIPIELKKFISYIEKEVDRKIVYLGTGRKVSDLISYE